MAKGALCALAPFVCGAALAACSQNRYVAPSPPVFDTDVSPILQARCASCHGGTSPAAGWSVTSFLSTIGCVDPSGAPATLPASPRAPVLGALATAPHVGLLQPGEQATLAAWVLGGAPAFSANVHPPGIVDPRSSAFHGTLLRAQRWSQMLDPNDPNACGGCHDGAPTRPAGVTLAAPGAPACTTCHTEPQGALACSTCHGDGTRSYPPRDLCFFPGDAAGAGSHAAHVETSEALTGGVPCSTCHPTPPADVIGGLHGNGIVEVIFDASSVGPEASYDPATGICAVTCHDSGGARPRPSFSETTPMGCTDCHGSPPANHFPGSCTNCHSEANATGTALTGGPLHLDGRVELGNGSGLCGACHGSGADPWPTTAAHPSHENPTLTVPLSCSSCHVVPQTILDPTHLDGTVHVTFSGLAVARESSPVWNGSSCTNVACHGANLADPAGVPQWTDPSGAAAACGACHGIPPSDHTPSMSCGLSNCHGSEIGTGSNGVPFITVSGMSLHIDGIIEHGQP